MTKSLPDTDEVIARIENLLSEKDVAAPDAHVSEAQELEHSHIQEHKSEVKDLLKNNLQD